MISKYTPLTPQALHDMAIHLPPHSKSSSYATAKYRDGWFICVNVCMTMVFMMI